MPLKIVRNIGFPLVHLLGIVGNNMRTLLNLMRFVNVSIDLA
jgi:hypothetical protein